MKPYIGLRSKKQQHIDENDIKSVIDALCSDNLTQGPIVESFENAMSAYCKVNYSVAVNSATSALHLACLSVGLGKGDQLWTSPNTFVASANCAYYCGADVDFVDISSHGYNMDVDQLEDKLIKANKANKLPKIILPVHFSGESADMKRIYQLAKNFDIYVFEDASHAVGSEYLGDKVGSCRYSDAAIFSFHPVKIMTSGEGGMVVTNNQEISENVYHLRSHGITRDPVKMYSDKHGPWHYQQLSLGYNYRLTDIQAALGLSQLKRVDEFVARRNAISSFYNNNLNGINAVLPSVSSDVRSSWHLYVIRVLMNKVKKTKKQIFEELWDRSVPLNVHYIPVHTQPYYQSKGFKSGQFPNAERHYEEAISLPIHCNLDEDELDHIVSQVRAVLG